MNLIAPLRAWCPAPELASAVAAPPYDVMSAAEALALAVGKPLSFLHVSRPEVDLPPGTSSYSPQAYAKAADNWRALQHRGVLRAAAEPAFFVYRLRMGEYSQTGVVVAASVQAYNSGLIARHELTRPDKEDDRVQHILALGAQTGPALLAWRDEPAVDQWLADASAGPPEVQFSSDEGVHHSLWRVDAPERVQALLRAFAAVPRLYIADGHHRSAAASRVAAEQPDNPLAQRFLAVAFAAREMRILDYNRLIRDLGGISPQEFLGRAGSNHAVQRLPGRPELRERGQLGLYLGGAWHVIQCPTDQLPTDPVDRLDVSLLHDRLIAPLLGIVDPRRDRRIDFVGGIRGLGELERRVDSGEMALAFALRPTSMEDLMAVADSGRMMPPKSTWFEPKLADGLVSYAIR